MGVQGLWELLAPVGRRVSVETLAGKKLAIDASIWMIQFMKAMRDEKGEMVRNAHILGFFRRICKLLYLRTKPVFVFDGGTPALKRRTVIARRRQRENAQAKIRKTAEKLLLNHLKAMRLKELAAGLEKQRQENDIKGKRPIIEEPNHEHHTERGNDDMGTSYNQEELDALLAASLAAEENEGFGVDASPSGSRVPDDKVLRDGDEDEDEDEDDDEEMILPEMHGKVDPAILAALPPSMQLDLLVQMRERLMAENRQKYQKVKKAPASFSELQIQSYLKTVAFRREIDGVQKSAAGRGIGGMQTSRIASEANREFIFSSSFTGDKEALTSVGQEKVASDHTVGQEKVASDLSQPPPVNSSTSSVDRGVLAKRSDAVAGPTTAEAREAFHDDVETYLDERGRLRVSRVRALGIRMTRDLQRNLDLMKEIDREKADTNQDTNNEITTAGNLVDVLDNSSDKIQHQENTDKHSGGVNNEVDKTEEPPVVNGTSIEISFEDTCEHEYGNDDDNLFARLVAGDPVVDLSVDNATSGKLSLNSDSDCEWEDGVVEDKSKAYPFEGVVSDAEEVEWEEGYQEIQLKPTSCPGESQNTVTKGALQEEADLQEAIRRSLDDTREMDDIAREMDGQDADLVAVNEGKEGTEVEASVMDVKEPLSSVNIFESNCSETKSAAFIEVNPDKSNLDRKLLNQDAGESGALARQTLVSSDRLTEEKELYIIGKQQIDTCNEEGNGGAGVKLVDTCSDLDPKLLNQDAGESGALARETLVSSDRLTEEKELYIIGKQQVDTCNEEGNGGAGVKLVDTCSNLDPILLNQDAGESGALARDTLVSSDRLTEEKELYIIGKQQIDTCNEEGNGGAGVKLVDTCSREVALNSISSAVSSFFADSQRESLLDSGSSDAQHMFQAASDDHSCKTVKPGNISVDDSISCVNGMKELSNEKVYGDSSIEKEDPTRNSSFMDVNEEHEIMEDRLEEEMLFLGKEREELGSEQRKLERNAESVSSEMFAECQELLQMFGLPYIIAPMEAEAQCAFMELSNLVDGVVTDDSDAFLFGARSVYKNIFDDRKYVETYLMKDIENELGLDRERLIHMALLLGSDYTEGVSGIGIVNAIEVVNAFPEKDGLREFREWIESPDPSILGKLDVEEGENSRKRGSKKSENIKEGTSYDQNVPESADDAKRMKQIFMNKHRNVSKNWHIPSTFPSDAVISAYVSPQVDKSTEPFGWGKPDLFVLRKLCWEKFGWGTSKADELLLPVLKEYNKHETQLRLEAFYTFNERFAKIRSKRIKKAVKGIAGNKSSELMVETMPQQPGKGKKRKVKPIEDEANQSEVGATGLDHAGTSNQNNTIEKPTVKRSRGTTKENTSQKNLEQSKGVRGRQRGRGRGQPSGRGKRKNNSSHPDTETSCDDGSTTENEEEMQFNKTEKSHEVRRSGRPRKIVNYTVSDEYDKFDKDGENCPSEDATNQAVSDINERDASKLNESRDINMGKMSTGQIDDHLNQNELPKDDYLQFGGGFCFDEDEEKMEVDGNSSSHKTETIPEKLDSVVEENHESDPSVITPKTSNGKTDLTDTAINMKDKTQSDYFSLDDTEDDLGNSSLKSLRAMPNLRRKKRKT
ncbi:hypothetical protein BUALT_Bualt04G0156000 [Buddleja alternifolia]|uniref:DNA repair protein UVH3 n=1 Tax=Buddleja alternifolia TaxID=168488 RepID=A0AAV6XWM1_9LAMI|nr:hypothetical protein BUALT_Bualt04G0156000 [Buddleja alternifolia]